MRMRNIHCTITPGSSVPLLYVDEGGCYGGIFDASNRVTFAICDDDHPGWGSTIQFGPSALRYITPVDPGDYEGPPLVPPTPPVLPPISWTERLAVRADFAYTETSGMNSSWQSYAYAGWDATKRVAARALWHQIGMTHVPVSWALNYPSAGPAFDYRSRPSDFAQLLRELHEDGFLIALAATQEEAYGKFPSVHANVRDIARWSEWGWTDYIDLAWPGWESNDMMTATATVEVLRALRRVLGPSVVLGVQPGRQPTEPYLYVADDQYPDRDAFWRAMHDPTIALDLFFFEASMSAFEGTDWRERVFDELMGASARLYRRIDRVPSVFPFQPFHATDRCHDNWTRADPIDGGNVPLVYWEGPAYLRWSSTQKSEASRIARLVPGVIGTGDGV